MQWAKLQLLLHWSQFNTLSLSGVTRETNRHFKKQKREYLRDKINQLETNNKKVNI